MKKERGMGILGIIVTVILIIFFIVLSYNFFSNMAKDSEIEDIKANMLVIQGKSKIIKETSKANNNEEGFVGKRISEMREDNIIASFLEKGVINEEELDKYYVLSNEDMKSMGLDVKNEKKSYYITNYESNEVFITKGYKDGDTEEVIYKLENI